MMSTLTLATLQCRTTVLADMVPPQTDIASTRSTEYVLTGLDILDSFTGVRQMILVAVDTAIDVGSAIQKSGCSLW